MPSTAVLTAYEAALPADSRVSRKHMFESPCAFVNRQMFFGTFEETVVARVGPERAAALADQPGMGLFSPTEGKVWNDYVQLEIPADAQLLSDLAAEALDWAAALPKKGKWKKGKRRKA